MCDTKNFYLWAAQVVFLTGLIALLLWISLRPQSPSYTVSDFVVPTNESQDISFALIVDNSNKYYRIYYNDINVTVNYGDDWIGSTMINAFDQNMGAKDSFHSSVKADRRLLKLASRAVSNETAEFRVGLVTTIRYRMSVIGAKKSKHHAMKLQGRVLIGKDGKIKNKKKKIKLRRASNKMRGMH